MYDAIIVLGCGNGVLTDCAIRRVKKAVALYKRCPCVCIFTGRRSMLALKRHACTEAHVMAAYARSLGVHYRDIVLEEQSVDTITNAMHTKKILRKRMQKKRSTHVAIVTSKHHIWRAKIVFRMVYRNIGSDIQFIGC